jgi:ribosomal protein S18 acetylase RimI-like enzyme
VTGLRFRPARPEDADQVVPLMRESSRALIDFTFDVGHSGGPAGFLRMDFLGGRGIFGYRNQVVGVSPAGEVVATATAYEGRRYRALSMWTLLTAVRHFNPACLTRVVRRTAAVAGLFLPPSRSGLFLANLCVAPGHRSHGHGSLLLEHILGTAQARGITRSELDVSVSNVRAQQLYERLGYVVVTETTDGGTHGLDGFRRMRRTSAPG